MKALLFLLFAPLTGGCSLFVHQSLPDEPPPLADLEVPLELVDEPRDEDLRVALEPGSFTGIYAETRAGTLDQLAEGGEGVLVARVVENSPADLAGVLEGDAILEVRAGGKVVAPRWPSEWRALELELAAGTRFEIVVDRAAVERMLAFTTVPRVRAAARGTVERFREEDKVGLVVRTATEVEARAAGLGPGGGAVVVGLSRASPWRAAGLCYLDLVARVDGVDVAHPQVLIDAIRSRETGAELALDVVREGRVLALRAPLGRRAGEVRQVSIPLLYEYTKSRGRSETSILFGALKHESTRAAWRTRLLWLFTFAGGDADRLAEEGS